MQNLTKHIRKYFFPDFNKIMLEIVVHTKIKILTNSTKNRETVLKKQTHTKQEKKHPGK